MKKLYNSPEMKIKFDDKDVICSSPAEGIVQDDFENLGGLWQ